MKSVTPNSEVVEHLLCSVLDSVRTGFTIEINTYLQTYLQLSNDFLVHRRKKD